MSDLDKWDLLNPLHVQMKNEDEGLQGRKLSVKANCGAEKTRFSPEPAAGMCRQNDMTPGRLSYRGGRLRWTRAA